MADFDIKILLAQAKDDPRFQNITTNGLRMGSTALSNDPIVSGVDGGNTPLLFNVASNVPGLFDVAIDIFIVLREEIANTVKITDILTTVQSKKIREVLKIQDILQFETTRAKKDVVATVSRFQLEQKKALRSLFKVSDNVQELSHESRFEAVQKAISVVRLSKLEKKEFHRLSIGQKFPNYALANRVSKDYGMIAGLGRDVTGMPPHPNQREDAYEFVHTNHPASLPVIPSGTVGAGYWRAVPGEYFNTTNSQNPSDPLGDLSNKHVLYGDENGVIPLDPYLIAGGQNGFFPFWNKDEINNRFGELADGSTGYVYWWMPEYRQQLGPFLFNDQAYTGIPESGTFIVPGVGTFSNVVNRSGNLYFYDVKNGSFPPTNIGINTPFDPSGAVEVIRARDLPANEAVDLKGEGELAELISQIINVIKTNNLPVQKVDTISKILTPKARVVRNRLKINEFILFFQTINEKSENIEATDLYEDKLNKGLKEVLKARNFVLTPKGVLNTEKVFSKSTNSLKVTTEIPTQIIKQIMKVTKHISLFDQEEADIISNLLNNPSRFILNIDRFFSKIETRLETNKAVLNKVKVVDKPQLGPNKLRLNVADVKEFLLGLAKARLQNERIQSISKRFNKLGKPLQNYLKEKDFISLEPGVNIENETTVINNVLAGKARLLTESLLAISDVDILREVKPEVLGVLNDLRLTKIVTKPIHDDRFKVKDNVIPAKSEIKVNRLSVISRDRDKGGASDVFFTFKPSIVNEFAFYNDNKRFIEVKKLLNTEKAKARINIIAAKSELFTDRNFIRDERHSFEIGKNLRDKILISNDFFDREIRKPLKTVGDLKEFLLSRPAKFSFNTERANVKDKFEPLVFKKLIPEHEITTQTVTSKKTEKNDEGITEFLSSSEKGVIWMRDEEYTRGAYFLEPYVAAIPPGRSRQF